jgi:hypothetical protein
MNGCEHHIAHIFYTQFKVYFGYKHLNIWILKFTRRRDL